MNPLKRHSTAEMRVCAGDRMRGMFAFFCKSNVVRALGVGAADADERGLDEASWRERSHGKRGKRKRAKTT